MGRGTSKGHWVTRRRAQLAGCAAILFALPCRGNVVNDRSLGPAAVTSTPGTGIFAITPASGRRVGSTLFFSFKHFTLHPGDAAQFTVPARVRNVIVRVTGQKSTINGVIGTSTFTGATSTANFLLMDASGILFHPGASLQVGGSYTVTTANVIRLSDGSSFAATPSMSDQHLSTAAPAGFGFLTSSPAAIEARGPSATTLIAPEGRTFSIVGGNVSLSRTVIGALGGRINLVSAAMPGVITLNPSYRAAATPHGPAQGQIDLFESSLTVATPALPPGENIAGSNLIDIRGGTLDATGQKLVSGISAQTQQDQAGGAGGIHIHLDRDLYLQRAAISATGSKTQAGNIDIVAGGNVTLRQVSPTFKSALTFIESQAHDLGGIAGSISLQAANLAVLGRAFISTDTSSSGAVQAGNIAITIPGSVTLDGAGLAFTNADPRGIESKPLLPNVGSAGTIDISTPSLLQIESGSRITTATTGPGTAGNIVANAQRIVIDAAGNSSFTGLLASSKPLLFVPGQSVGNGGSIDLSGSQVSVLNGGVVAARSATSDAGSIVVHATDDITVNGGRVTSSAALGAGGDIKLSSLNLLQMFDGHILAIAGSQGGNISLGRELVVLNRSTISASALVNGGRVTIQPRAFLPSADSSISATGKRGVNGQVDLTPPDANIVTSLVALPSGLLNQLVTLDPACIQSSPTNVSSFIVTGQGGLALQPGGWSPNNP